MAVLAPYLDSQHGTVINLLMNIALSRTHPSHLPHALLLPYVAYQGSRLHGSSPVEAEDLTVDEKLPLTMMVNFEVHTPGFATEMILEQRTSLSCVASAC